MLTCYTHAPRDAPAQVTKSLALATGKRKGPEIIRAFFFAQVRLPLARAPLKIHGDGLEGLRLVVDAPRFCPGQECGERWHGTDLDPFFRAAVTELIFPQKAACRERLK